MSSMSSKNEKQITLKNVDLFFPKLHVNCYIIKNPPKPYPSSTSIKKLNSQKHALCSRRFKTSMLCYDVSNCDCCENMCICHFDNLLI